jgi:hypothetical protein
MVKYYLLPEESALGAEVFGHCKTRYFAGNNAKSNSKLRINVYIQLILSD